MLEGQIRESIGKSNAKQLKRDGYLIANIYAKGMENVYAAFKEGDFIKAARAKETLILPVRIEGKEYNTVIQEYQFHPVTGAIRHVDLRVALPGVVTDYLVPVKTTGVPIGLKNKGVLIQSKKRLKLRGKIEDMPANITLDVSALDRDDSILVRDIEAPINTRIMDRDHVAICGVIKSK
jgi:large subunit ribosomal protein L25